MNLYNSLTRQIEEFSPRGSEVTVYVCGITPYDTTHLGHAFTYVIFDVLIRYLEAQGHTVRYTQNVTDIDDDILRKAKEVSEDWQQLANRWTAHFIRDLIALNVRPPDHYPRATTFIEEIITTVQQLLDAGVGYTAGGSVYFDLDRWEDFGKLSGLDRPTMLETANERGNNPDDPHKRAPLDFVLWQAKAPGEPSWPSPWGEGRPGWHIECSTMATQLMGQTIDIHGGGSDLEFPHHECEIAQSECATGQRPFARFWVHTAMVHHEGEKMSKSLGNLIMAADLLQIYSADAIRVYLAGHHYRTPWEYAEGDLQKAQSRADRLCAAVSALSADGDAVDATGFAEGFTQAMDDDLNTPAALRTLDQLADQILAASERAQNVDEAQTLLRQSASILGLRLDHSEPEQHVTEGWNRHLVEFDGKKRT
ncbi:MAG: cysteine--tRNA ligase [Caldilineaceae bacterium]|nr:cysteine--tRNA ligase [Caldilineaceae bacterium]